MVILKGPGWAAAWQQQVGEYKALCYQAYNLAQRRLDILLQQQYIKPVIVTDIDETVLDNSPYQVPQAVCNAEYSDSSWVEWAARIDCDTIPGPLSFFCVLQKAKELLFFHNTNRLGKERAATLQDLQCRGFPDAANEYLTMNTTTSGKEPRLKK